MECLVTSYILVSLTSSRAPSVVYITTEVSYSSTYRVTVYLYHFYLALLLLSGIVLIHSVVYITTELYSCYQILTLIVLLHI